MLILGIALCVYGALRYDPDLDKAVFVVGTIITRIIEGNGSALAYTVYLPLLTISFHTDRDQALTARTCGSQLGKSVGFVLGGVAFHVLGYCG